MTDGEHRSLYDIYVDWYRLCRKFLIEALAVQQSCSSALYTKSKTQTLDQAFAIFLQTWNLALAACLPSEAYTRLTISSKSPKYIPKAPHIHRRCIQLSSMPAQAEFYVTLQNCYLTLATYYLLHLIQVSSTALNLLPETIAFDQRLDGRLLMTSCEVSPFQL